MASDTSLVDAMETLDRALERVPLREAERTLSPRVSGCPHFHVTVYRLSVAMHTAYGHDMDTCIGRMLQAIGHWCTTHRDDLREAAIAGGGANRG